MKFAYAARDREVAFIIRLLTIFGVVEQRQMRLLFNHLSNRSYGQILARLRREGLAYFSPDGQFLATSRYSLDHGKTLESVMVFWAFIKMRDNVLDFCASDPPAILSFSSAAKDYDLIPGSKQNIPAINAARTVVAEATVRLIVVDDLSTLDEVEPRLVNDYGILVGPNGVEHILAELKPTIEFDDCISSGTLSLDHSTIKTEAAGYKSSSYTVTATKNYTGLDRNDSSYIDKTVEKNGRTLSLSNVTWSVERTALVGDELVPATYSAVATYSGTASSTVATGYITTAEYKGTVVSSGISSILYTVTYLGTEIVPVEEEPTFNGSIVVIPVIGGTILLATLLLLGLLLRKNTTVYKATGKGNEYEKCGRLRLKTKDPELRIDRLKDIPEGMIAVEVDQAVAKKLFGQTIAIHCYDNTVEHTVGTVNGQYWFKVDIGTQEGEPDTEEEPV